MDALAVLISGGLDSAILLGDALLGDALLGDALLGDALLGDALLGDALRRRSAVYPVYIRCGLFWETVELSYLGRFLAAVGCDALRPLTVLDMPVADLYGKHWSVTGEAAPDAGSPDAAVFLPGRNVLLLTKALLWCHLHGIPELALGSLGTNPFPDASPAFFQEMQNLINESVTGSVAIRLPFAAMSKNEVMRLGRNLPLEYTFSCIRPIKGRHCGRCNKCAERRRAFADAGMRDPTECNDS
jgi:7-cyano-7-deazaguanine synthase